MTDLTTLIPADSGWVLAEATAINAAGQIVGVGTRSGQQRGFLLTPVGAPSPAQIPAQMPNTGGGGGHGWPSPLGGFPFMGGC